MEQQVRQALAAFTHGYVELWRRETGRPPASEELYGVASPCVVESEEPQVRWLPQPMENGARLDGVERALEIALRPEAHAFFTSQYAGDMTARFDEVACTLLQAWSAEDLVRMQENLSGHLVTQRRLKLSPTLFLAATPADMTLVSLCNLSGEVVLEEFGTRQRRVLAPSLADFLYRLQPAMP